MVELDSDAYPDERLIACYNSSLAQRRRQQRLELLQATEQELDKIIAAVLRDSRPLRGSNNIGVRVGKVINRFKVAKHFHTEITDNNFRAIQVPNRATTNETGNNGDRKQWRVVVEAPASVKQAGVLHFS